MEQQRRDQVALVEALEQVDRVQHVPRVRVAELLHERLDREQIGLGETQLLRLHVLGVETAAEGHHVAALGPERRAIHSAITARLA